MVEIDKIDSVTRNAVCLDQRALPYHVARIEGKLLDGRPFITLLDEVLVRMKHDSIDPRLLLALVEHEG